MRVVLTSDVPGVGRASDLVDVQPGYFRNFLAPSRLAQAATPAVLAVRRRTQAAADRLRAARAAERAATLAAVNGATVKTRERAARGKLFGSVTADRIRGLVREQLRHDLPRDAILLEHPLRTVGPHAVTVRLDDQTATLNVNILDAGG